MDRPTVPPATPAPAPADQAGPGSPADQAAAKTALRTAVRAARHRRAVDTGTGPTDRDARDTAIRDALSAELDRHDPGCTGHVAVYSPLPGEPGGADLPERLAATGRTVWLPVVDAPGRPLHWARWTGDTATRRATFGIREPVVTGAAAPVTTQDLLPRLVRLILPALAVGADGVRLGQGGGFYDRSLASVPPGAAEHGRLMAIVDHEEFGIPVPGTDLDITVPVVVTDRGVFPTGVAG